MEVVVVGLAILIHLLMEAEEVEEEVLVLLELVE
jgi:hypothetical protein